eukprot:g11786.t1
MLSAHRPTTDYCLKGKKFTSSVRLIRPFSLLLPSSRLHVTPLKGLPQDLSVRLLSGQREHGKQKSGPRKGTRDDRAQLSRRLKSRLKRTVEDNEIQKAWSIFDELQAMGTIDVQDCNTMLEACFDAAQMRKLMNVAISGCVDCVDVEPNIATYNMLIDMLRIEGDDEAAKNVVEEMKKAGVRPDERTKEILNSPARGKDLSKMRTNKLAWILKQG